MLGHLPGAKENLIATESIKPVRAVAKFEQTQQT